VSGGEETGAGRNLEGERRKKLLTRTLAGGGTPKRKERSKDGGRGTLGIARISLKKKKNT